eukprot:scaffold5252_cov72-Skeletonema_dohrnii-CCMP3373.AAC.2
MVESKTEPNADIMPPERHKKELLQAAATLDTTTNRHRRHSQRGHQLTCLAEQCCCDFSCGLI